MNPPKSSVLTINGGSSSIKFALFESGSDLRRVFYGQLEGIGQATGRFISKGLAPEDNFTHTAHLPDYTNAISLLMAWLQKRIDPASLTAVGHRIVHGGPDYWEPQIINLAMIKTLLHMSPFDTEHLPEEILLAEAFHRRFPQLPQIACFDTAFHHDMPRMAHLLPIPRRYQDKGVQRYGFHGLSCAFLMEELARLTDQATAQGRIVLAHLGNGASVTAVQGGKSIDTSMGFTPNSGLPMGTRSGDLDPALVWYLVSTEKMAIKDFYHMVTHESGLLGVSEISSDMQVLISKELDDVRAAEAIGLFCYQTKKTLCGLIGVLEGLDTLVFSGGIGENSAEIRARICSGLGFLGIEIDPIKNAANNEVISSESSAITVRVIKTDEELMIAKTVFRMLDKHQNTAKTPHSISTGAPPVTFTKDNNETN